MPCGNSCMKQSHSLGSQGTECWDQRIRTVRVGESNAIATAVPSVSCSEEWPHWEGIVFNAALFSVMSLRGAVNSPSSKQNGKSVHVVQMLFKILAISHKKSPCSHIKVKNSFQRWFLLLSCYCKQPKREQKIDNFLKTRAVKPYPQNVCNYCWWSAYQNFNTMRWKDQPTSTSMCQ